MDLENMRVIIVKRGDMRMMFPMESGHDISPAGLASQCVGAFMQLQGSFPGRSKDPVVFRRGREFMLKIEGVDGVLDPEITLEAQVMGHWQDVEVDIAGDGPNPVAEEIRKAPGVFLELVNT